jgi:DNA-binding transcriptional ArsR family regulator
MPSHDLFKALADPSRRKILKLLQGGSRTAGELAEDFNVLKAADLVRCERRGQQLIYSLNTSVFEDLAALMMDLFRVTEESDR